jgi:hypothetical protein
MHSVEPFRDNKLVGWVTCIDILNPQELTSDPDFFHFSSLADIEDGKVLDDVFIAHPEVILVFHDLDRAAIYFVRVVIMIPIFIYFPKNFWRPFWVISVPVTSPVLLCKRCPQAHYFACSA